MQTKRLFVLAFTMVFAMMAFAQAPGEILKKDGIRYQVNSGGKTLTIVPNPKWQQDDGLWECGKRND